MSARILFVAPRMPYPLENGWNQRMFHLLTALADLGPVRLLCYEDPESVLDEPRLEHFRDLCETVEILPQPAPRWPAEIRSYRDVIERLVVSRRPRLVAEFPGQALAERLVSLALDADLIWVERIFLAEWLTAGLEKTIVDVDDLESVKGRRRLALQRVSPWRLALRLDNLKLRRVERRSTSRYARVVVSAESDRRFFPAPERVLAVPNGIPADLLCAPESPRDPATIVMVGTMRYGPNADGALWFTREVFPRIVAARPDVRLFLVGDNRHGAIRSAHDGERVVVTGRVDDVVPHVSRATLSVVPLRVAGGTRIKILESLALRTPVVSTTIGAEGLDLVPGQHIRLGDTPEEFAAAVVDLLGDAGARRAMAEAGRQVIAERYTWDVIGRGLRDALRGWLADRAQRRARTGMR